jgi:hypothetical protein
MADGGGEGRVVVGMRRIEPLVDIEVAFARDVDTFDSIELPVKGTGVGLPELKAEVPAEEGVGHRDVAGTGKGRPVLFHDVVETEERPSCLTSATVLTHGDPLSNMASASWYTSGCKGTLGLREGKVAFWHASFCRQQALRRRTTGSAGGGGDGWTVSTSTYARQPVKAKQVSRRGEEEDVEPDGVSKDGGVATAATNPRP